MDVTPPTASVPGVDSFTAGRIEAQRRREGGLPIPMTLWVRAFMTASFDEGMQRACPMVPSNPENLGRPRHWLKAAERSRSFGRGDLSSP